MPLNLKNFNNFSIDGDVVRLNKDYLNKAFNYFKKITGTRFASIVGLSKYNSPFKTWMMMTNLFTDTMDPTLAIVGNTIEPKIRDYVTKQLNIQYKVYNPREINWDVFKENKIFGGIPDGEPLNDVMVVDYSNDKPMLEIKTSSIDSFVYKKDFNNCLKMQKDINGIPLVKEKNGKKDSWFKDGMINISGEYKMQLGLYLYLRNINHGVFAVGFLTGEDYVKPELFDTNTHDIRLVDFYVDLNKFKEYIDYATEWYNNYIKTGTSPKMTIDDKKWLEEEMKLVNK